MSHDRYIIYIIYPLARVPYSFSYIITYIKYYFWHTYYILWIMYCTLLNYIQFRSNAKYKIDSLLGCWAWCSKTALNVGKNWFQPRVIFKVPAWFSCLSFPNHFLRNLEWAWEFPITTVSCLIPTCVYFSVFFGRLLHEKICCLENLHYIFTALKLQH